MKLSQWEQTLDEVHYKDLYPKQFEEFRKKYNKIVRSRLGGNLYVQYTDFADSTLQKAPYTEPNHSDPVGTYAYPLEYVIKFPADVWYGKASKFLRVIESKTTAIIYLQEIKEYYDAERVLYKMGFRHVEDLLKKANKNYRHTGARKWAKAMLSVIQMRLEDEPTLNQDKEEKYTPRSGTEQTALFRKAGFKAIVDDARRASAAVMNNREPQQIAFLSRDSFEVIDIYNLRPAKEPGKDMMNQPEPPDSFEQKLISRIAYMMDDRLENKKAERSSLGGWSYYWTQGKRRVEIEISQPADYYTNLEKRGYKAFSMSKPHREHKLHDPNQVSVVINSEKGRIKETYDAEATMEDVLEDLENEWRTLSGEPFEGWTPELKKDYFDKKDAERDEWARKENDKKDREDQADYPGFRENFNKIAAHFNLSPITLKNKNSKMEFVRMCKDMKNRMSHTYHKFKDQKNAWDKKALRKRFVRIWNNEVLEYYAFFTRNAKHGNKYKEFLKDENFEKYYDVYEKIFVEIGPQDNTVYWSGNPLYWSVRALKLD